MKFKILGIAKNHLDKRLRLIRVELKPDKFISLSLHNRIFYFYTTYKNVRVCLLGIYLHVRWG